MSIDIATILPQMEQALAAVKTASEGELQRREQALRLAMWMLDWENEQPPLGNQLADMLLVGLWANIAKTTGTQVTKILSHLDPAKKKLDAQLKEFQEAVEVSQPQIKASQEELKNKQAELDSLQAKLNLASTELSELSKAQTTLDQRLQAALTYEKTRADIEQAQKDLATYIKDLTEGFNCLGDAHPARQLADALRLMLDICRQQHFADKEITEAMTLFDSSQSVLLSLPELLGEIEQGLQKVEQALAAQIKRQDAVDKEVAEKRQG